MIELQGKYGQAKVFTDVVDNDSISQVITLLNQPYAESANVRMMPDIHAGMGCTIGTTMRIRDQICPNLVGVDIGCGMETIYLKEKRIELQKLDKLIRQEIPSGFVIRQKPHRFAKEIDLDELYCAKHVKLDRALLSIGTLGGGNHFIEADRDDDGNLYLVIHSGSRNLGKQVAELYQKLAINLNRGYGDYLEKRDEIIRTYKEQGRKAEAHRTSCAHPQTLKGFKPKV
jgi:RNA-splicing ligase RtcB